MDPKNELLAVLKDGKRLKIITAKGTLTITLDEAESIKSGNYPAGIKDSPLMKDIPFAIVYKEVSKILKKSPKEEERNSENLTVVYKVRFTINGLHYAEIEDKNGTLKFLQYGNGNFLVLDQVTISDPENPEREVIIRPAPQIAQTKMDRIFDEDRFSLVKFPPYPNQYGTATELYNNIKNFLHKHVELRPEDEILLPLWLMKATLFDVIKDTSFPLVHVIAPLGHGKTRLLSVLTEITPWGFYLVNISSAPLKRVSELYKPILYVDEKGQMDNDTAAIINAKFNRNSVILNADKEIQRGFSALIGYQIYSPLILAGRTPFHDDAIESKAFQINQDFELSRTDIPRKIKGKKLDEFQEEARIIRGKLLQFRIDYHDKINDVEGSNFLEKFEQHLEPRLFEILAFFEDLIELIPSLKGDILKLLEYQIKRNVEVATQTPNGIVASTFLSIIENSEDEIEYTSAGQAFTGIRLADIYNEIGVNYAKQTGKILQSLGLITDRPRVEATDSKGNLVKKRITVVRIPDEKKLKELKARYDPKYVEEVLLPSIKQDLQRSLDEEVNEDYQKGNTPQANVNENGQKSEQASTNQNGETHVDNEVNEDNEKRDAPSSDNNNERKEGDSLNERPLRPLRPDSSQESGQNEKNDLPEVTGQKYEWGYFRVLDDFDYYFSSGERHRYKKDQVIKFSIIHAAKYVLKGLLKPACPNGHYDPVSRECIPDIGGINNEQ